MRIAVLVLSVLVPMGLVSQAAQQSVGLDAVLNEVQPALPVVQLPIELPEGFRPSGAREADGRRAFQEYVKAVLERLSADAEHEEIRGVLRQYLEAPAQFRLKPGPGSEAFLALTSRFVERRALEPTLATTIGLVGFQTWRRDPTQIGGPANAPFEEAMGQLAAYLGQTVILLNAAQPDAEPLRSLHWRGPSKEGGTAWIEGVQLGRGPRRIAILTHVDTVAPIRDDWQPFVGRLAVLPFRGKQHLFVLGRGSIDDKGPTAAALHVLDALRAVYSGTPLFEECTFELLADTAEETHSMFDDYFAANGTPEAGDVLDSGWSVYAEKGIERPVFRTAAGGPAPAGMHLVSLTTPDGPTNQIPDRATAVFAPGAGGPDKARAALEQAIAAYLQTDNERARLELSSEGQNLVVTAVGSGAAHGSAPNVNKEGGHNPLACLSVFVTGLHRSGQVEPSAALTLPVFLAWAFGHNVYGEDHRELAAKDETFTDGTTYALTRMVSAGEQLEARVDIRYALGHHGTPWDGKTFGILPGDSRFREILPALVERFNASRAAQLPALTLETKTAVGPDLKDKNHPVFLSLTRAYEQVVGSPSPLIAMGGGTDAKGFPMLYAAGPNFGTDPVESFAPPVNYHGVDEGAPVEDLIRSAQILMRWLPDVGFAPKAP